MKRSSVWVLMLIGACESGGTPAGDDAGLASRTFGETCTDGAQCIDSHCLALAPGRAICTHVCATDADCPGGSSWGCIQPDGDAPRVCGCAPDATAEVCGDGLDNECNGRVDDCRICGGVAVPEDSHEHCGSCDHACRADQECSAGSCGCPIGLTECGGRCVDTRTSTAHCGACGEQCAFRAECVDGACGCPASAPDECDGACVDTDTHVQHCGACGHACPSTLDCVAGECECGSASAPLYCTGVGCVDPSTDHDHCGGCARACDDSEVCTGGTCRCPVTGWTFCGDGCIDTTSDPSNCGSCGNVCPPGTYCAGSNCHCDSGLFCDGVCVAAGDPANCGGCGVACRADQYCTGRGCACALGRECGGLCVDTGSDPRNCGGCGVVCGEGMTCSSGSCVCTPATPYSCPELGGCFDLRSDPMHCGACTTVCAPAQVCSSSACRCPVSGQTYCSSEGACFDLRSDPSHCGSCGNVCPSATACIAGSCQCPVTSERYCATIDRCVDTSTDAANCGSCGNACPAASTCRFGSCRCDVAGLTACPGGCADLQTDEASCGSCGRACTVGLECRAGSCYCPVSTPATPVRLTDAVGDTVAIAAAASATHVAVVYADARTVTTGEVYLQRLNLDGTPAGAEIVLASAHGRYADVVWTGTEWGVAWIDDGIGWNTRLARFDADGVQIGTTVSIPCKHPGTTSIYGPTSDLTLAWHSMNGYTIVRQTRLSTYDLVFQILGPDGTTPRVPTLVAASGGRPDLAVAPDGRYAVAYLGTRSGTLVREIRVQPVELDGSVTASYVVVVADTDTGGLYGVSHDVALVHDGGTWVLGVRRTVPGTGGMYLSEISVRRGPTLAASRIVASYYGAYDGPRPVRRPTLAVRAGEVVVSWQQRDASETGHHMHTQRHRIPALATDALAPSEPASVAMPAITMNDTSWQTVATPGGVVHAWSDTRWGQAEAYAMSISMAPCP